MTFGSPSICTGQALAFEVWPRTWWASSLGSRPFVPIPWHPNNSSRPSPSARWWIFESMVIFLCAGYLCYWLRIRYESTEYQRFPLFLHMAVSFVIGSNCLVGFELFGESGWVEVWALRWCHWVVQLTWWDYHAKLCSPDSELGVQFRSWRAESCV